MVQILFDSDLEFYSVLIAVAAWLYVVIRTGEKPSTKIAAYIEASRQFITDINGMGLAWFGKTDTINMTPPNPEVRTVLEEIKIMLTNLTEEFATLQGDVLILGDRIEKVEDPTGVINPK